MIFNLRFLITLILIVAIIISFVLIVLEVVNFNGTTEFVFTAGSGATAKDKKLDELKAADAVTLKVVGTTPNTLLSETQYYRYGSLVMHILAILSGVYVVYSG